MMGNNTFIFNQATMNAAIEYYLNNVVLKSPCKVTNVVYTQNTGRNFEISVAPVENVTPLDVLNRAIAIEKG